MWYPQFSSQYKTRKRRRLLCFCQWMMLRYRACLISAKKETKKRVAMTDVCTFGCSFLMSSSLCVRRIHCSQCWVLRKIYYNSYAVKTFGYCQNFSEIVEFKNTKTPQNNHEIISMRKPCGTSIYYGNIYVKVSEDFSSQFNVIVLKFIIDRKNFDIDSRFFDKLLVATRKNSTDCFVIRIIYIIFEWHLTFFHQMGRASLETWCFRKWGTFSRKDHENDEDAEIFLRDEILWTGAG